jgi:glyoxylate reductase
MRSTAASRGLTDVSGVIVSNTPGAVDEATATTAVFLLIATMRRFSECEAHLRAGGFSPLKQVESGAHDLSGKTIGILGMGGIGLTIVNYIRAFGMKMLYHNRRKSSSAPADVEYCPDLLDMLGKVDVLMVSIPLSASTRGFIGEKEIRAMKKGSIIVNTARGPIIDEEAMIRALQDGHVSWSLSCVHMDWADCSLGPWGWTYLSKSRKWIRD